MVTAPDAKRLERANTNHLLFLGSAFIDFKRLNYYRPTLKTINLRSLVRTIYQITFNKAQLLGQKKTSHRDIIHQSSLTIPINEPTTHTNNQKNKAMSPRSQAHSLSHPLHRFLRCILRKVTSPTNDALHVFAILNLEYTRLNKVSPVISKTQNIHGNTILELP